MENLLRSSGDQRLADKFILRRVLYEQRLVYYNIDLKDVWPQKDLLNDFEFFLCLEDDTMISLLSKKSGVYTFPNRKIRTLDGLISYITEYLPYNKAQFCMKLDQSNGQLMGSILSFPILCQMNLLCYKLALEEYLISKIGKEAFTKTCKSLYGAKVPGIKIRALPCLVNGDDIYFRTNGEFYDIWRKWIKYAGFSLSLGKNYVHSNTFTINSRMFTLVGDTVTEITYLNCGLLQCKSKGGNTEPKSIDVIFNKVIAGATNKSFARNRFIHYNDKMLCQASLNGTYNYFLPKLLGGLGLRDDSPIRITHFQTNMASAVLKSIQDPFYKVSTINYTQKKSSSLSVPYLGDHMYKYIDPNGEMPEGYQLVEQVDFGPFSLLEPGSIKLPYKGKLIDPTAPDNAIPLEISSTEIIGPSGVITHNSVGTLYSRDIIQHDPKYRYTKPNMDLLKIVRSRETREKLYYFSKKLCKDGIYLPGGINYDTIIVESEDVFTDTDKYKEFLESWYPTFPDTIDAVPKDSKESI